MTGPNAGTFAIIKHPAGEGALARIIVFQRELQVLLLLAGSKYIVNLFEVCVPNYEVLTPALVLENLCYAHPACVTSLQELQEFLQCLLKVPMHSKHL